MKAFACLLIATGVIAGAFGAHALKDILSPSRLEVFKTAVFYQISISTTLLVLATQANVKKVILKCLALGIIIFSSSLYLLVLLEMKILGAITPIGGLLIIASLLLASYEFYKNPN